MNLDTRLSVMQRNSYCHCFKSRVGIEGSLCAFLIATRYITRRHERLLWEFLHKLQQIADAEVSFDIPSPL
jgi:hypothetical protein